ncbi:hypothetical protein M5K25_005384 [Dendrobium thyrsiflorum]|uniref:Uncharacterized protein n=1 Tax=Dendrobium thyrsiflorum TaxID=117978 RepID=A0ABD0VPR7_DENTH
MGRIRPSEKISSAVIDGWVSWFPTMKANSKLSSSLSSTFSGDAEAAAGGAAEIFWGESAEAKSSSSRGVAGDSFFLSSLIVHFSFPISVALDGSLECGMGRRR